MKTKLYLIPGIMCNEQLWSKITPLLDEYELVHVEIPLNNTLDEMMASLCEKIAENSINLLGFSLGGYIASYFACRYPHKIKRLLIMAATPCALPKEEILKREQALQLSQQFGFKSLSHQKIVSLLEESNQNNESLIKLIGDMYTQLGQKAFQIQLGSTLNREDLSQGLARLPLKVHFVYSNKDRLLNQMWIKKFSTLAHATFTQYNSNSHMLPLEKPRQISNEIAAWLNDNV